VRAPAKRSDEPTTAEAPVGALPAGPPRYFYVLQFALVNVVSTALCVAAWLEGWLDGAFTGTSLWLCLLIVAAFLYGLSDCGWHLWRVVREFDDLQAGPIRAASRAAWYLGQVGGVGARFTREPPGFEIQTIIFRPIGGHAKSLEGIE